MNVAKYDALRCMAVLDEFRPKIMNYSWMWKILKFVTKSEDHFPDRLYAKLRRWGNVRRPYFIGLADGDIKFLGDYRDYPSMAYMVKRGWNSGIVDFILSIPGCKDTYVDVGANFGVVAASVASCVGGYANVIALEPVVETAKRAAATFALNNITNVTLYQAALGDEDKEIEFFSSPGNSAIATIHQHDFQHLGDWQPISVPCIRLDSLRSFVGKKIDLIKIDAEGHELNVIDGARATLLQDTPSVLFEFTPALSKRYGYSATEVIERIADAGSYRFSVLRDNGSLIAYPLSTWSEQVNIYGECMK